MLSTPRSLGATLRACLLLVGTASASAYDPLDLPSGQPPQPLDIDVVDRARERTVPIRVLIAPSGSATAADRRPVVLFSHGLGGSTRVRPSPGSRYPGCC